MEFVDFDEEKSKNHRDAIPNNEHTGGMRHIDMPRRDAIQKKDREISAHECAEHKRYKGKRGTRILRICAQSIDTIKGLMDVTKPAD